MSALTRLNSKGQLTIPKDVRDALALAPGAELYVTVDNGRVLVTPKNGVKGDLERNSFMDLAGILGKPPNGARLDIDEIDEAIMGAVAKDDDRIQREWRQSRSSEK
jgi:AbrB family looped-hinge helix DNA binding protein